MTPANLVTAVQANLADDRMYGIQLFIEKLLKRTTYGDGIEQYRMTNLTTAAKITSMADFVAAITTAGTKANFPYTGEGMQPDRVVGFEVNLTNIEVEFHPLARDDQFFSQMYDFSVKKKFQFMLHMGYMNDGDEVVPLKVYYIRLVRKP